MDTYFMFIPQKYLKSFALLCNVLFLVLRIESRKASDVLKDTYCLAYAVLFKF